MDFIDDELLGELTRWLSKSGELMFEDELRKVVPSWSQAQKIELYEYLRDHGERFESEWRPQFIRIIEIDEEVLPDRKDAEMEEWGIRIFRLIEEGDLDAVRNFVEETGQLNQQFDPDEAYKDGKRYNKEVGTTVPFEFYPLEASNEECEYPEPFARSLGKIEIADYLKALIEQLSQRWSLAYEEGYQREMTRRRTFRISIHDDLSVSHNGVTSPLGELVSTAVSESANFLIMEIKRRSKAAPAAAWLPVMAAFQEAGIRDFENDWID